MTHRGPHLLPELLPGDARDGGPPLRRLRCRLGTQVAVAGLLGVSLATLQRWESGAPRGEFADLIDLLDAAVAHTTAAYVVGRLREAEGRRVLVIGVLWAILQAPPPRRVRRVGMRVER